MRSVGLQAAFERAEEREAAFVLTDYLHQKAALVVHDEGIMVRLNAFIEIDDDPEWGPWLVVFSEHQDIQIFHAEDVHWWANVAAQFPPEPPMSEAMQATVNEALDRLRRTSDD